MDATLLNWLNMLIYKNTGFTSNIIKKKGVKKYKNKSCKCRQLHIHRSIFESSVCNDLHLQYSKEIKNGSVMIHTEYKFEFKYMGIKICSHYVDFLITLDGGKEIAIEAKGFETAVWKIKRKLFKAFYPDIEYKVIKPKGNK